MRHAKPPKREIPADKVYNSRLVTKLINRVMDDGKKTTAERIVYKALDLIKEKENADPLELFEKAIQNIGPKVEVRARRIGGANYQVPTEVRGERRISLAIRWLLVAADARPNKEYHTFQEKLAAELLDAGKGEGAAIKKRDTVLRMAEANRAFAHFRF